MLDAHFFRTTETSTGYALVKDVNVIGKLTMNHETKLSYYAGYVPRLIYRNWLITVGLEGWDEDFVFFFLVDLTHGGFKKLVTINRKLVVHMCPFCSKKRKR